MGEQQESWLKTAGEEWVYAEGGFRAVKTVGTFSINGRKKTSRFLREVSYEGVLTVTDVEKFKELLCREWAEEELLAWDCSPLCVCPGGER